MKKITPKQQLKMQVQAYTPEQIDSLTLGKRMYIAYVACRKNNSQNMNYGNLVSGGWLTRENYERFMSVVRAAGSNVTIGMIFDLENRRNHRGVVTGLENLEFVKKYGIGTFYLCNM